jgi:hypothetical protein
MSKLRTALISLSICLPVIAFGDGMKPHSGLKGHPNLVATERDLAAAAAAIDKSQSANECVFGLEGGHGQKAKEAIEAAQKQVFESAEWAGAHDKDCKGNKGKRAGKVERMKMHGAMKGHGNLVAAEKDLVNAHEHISLSQEANECVFGVEGGHGANAKELIETAYKQVYEATEYINTHETECKEWMKKRH